MSRFVDLPALRESIVDLTLAAASAAWLGNVRVRVRIAVEPDARGERAVEVEVTGAAPEPADGDAFAARCALLELT